MLILYKVDFRTRNTTRDEERHFIVIKGLSRFVCTTDIPSKYINQKKAELNKKVDKLKNRRFQHISLSNCLNDICRTGLSKTAKYTYSSKMTTFWAIKTSFNKINRNHTECMC